MQVDGGRMLQAGVLRAYRFQNPRMAMAHTHRNDPSKSVEIALAAFIKHILHVAVHKHHRIAIIGHQRGGQETTAECDDFRLRRTFIFSGHIFAGWDLGHAIFFLDAVIHRAQRRW